MFLLPILIQLLIQNYFLKRKLFLCQLIDLLFLQLGFLGLVKFELTVFQFYMDCVIWVSKIYFTIFDDVQEELQFSPKKFFHFIRATFINFIINKFNNSFMIQFNIVLFEQQQNVLMRSKLTIITYDKEVITKNSKGPNFLTFWKVYHNFTINDLSNLFSKNQ